MSWGDTGTRDECIRPAWTRGSGQLGVRIGKLTNTAGHAYVRAYLANLDPDEVPDAIRDMREVGWPSEDVVDALEREFDRGLVA